MEPTKRPFPLLLALLIAVLLAGLVGLIVLTASLSSQFKAAFQPLQQANAGLSTQVSQLLHPTPTLLPDPVTIVNEVRALARLETIQYTVEKVITAEVNQGVFGPLFGDRLLFVAHGYVIAGVDLSSLAATDMNYADGILRVTLPPAEVFVATLNNNQSYVYDRETGILTKANPDLETSARTAAEQEILNAALDDGILAQADANARAYLLSLFNSLGFPRVVFSD